MIDFTALQGVETASVLRARGIESASAIHSHSGNVASECEKRGKRKTGCLSREWMICLVAQSTSTFCGVCQRFTTQRWKTDIESMAKLVQLQAQHEQVHRTRRRISARSRCSVKRRSRSVTPTTRASASSRSASTTPKRKSCRSPVLR